MNQAKRKNPPPDELSRRFGSASPALAFDLACGCAEADRPELFKAALPYIPESSLPFGKSEISQLIAIALHRKSRNFSLYLIEELIPALPHATQSALAGHYAHYVFVSNRFEPEDRHIASCYLKLADPQALRAKVAETAAKGFVDPRLFELACRFVDEATLETALKNAREHGLDSIARAIEAPLLILREQNSLEASMPQSESSACAPRI